ncbi:MAG TPA: hypothetical protein VHQ65_10460 [Thermoanaerobaculia bacterium]|nr:hypothetical protein [Thermoanaerobaculia bacterium]
MSTLDSRHDQARRYLLGRLDDRERDRFEAGLLADDDAYEAVLAAEDELIEEYARGDLDRRDHAEFAARHLGREGMGERIAFARVLAEEARHAARNAPRPARRVFGWLPRPALRLAAASAFVVLVALTGWLGWRAAQLEERVETMQAEQAAAEAQEAEIAALERQLAEARRAAADSGGEDAEEPAAGTVSELAAVRQRADHLAAELARLETEAAASEPVAVSFLLALATRSDRGVRELAVPPQAELVHLQLDTGGDEGYPAYRVRLLGPTGSEVWSRTGAEQTATDAGPVVAVTVPAEALVAGRHEVLVEGLADGDRAELVGAFEIEVVRGPVRR